METPFVIYEDEPVSYNQERLKNLLGLYEDNTNYFNDISNFSVSNSGSLVAPSNLPKMVESEKSDETQSITQPTTTQNTDYGDLLNLSFEDLIKQENLPIRITSGYRGAGSLRGGKTAQGRRSNHNRVDEHGHPMAYDIVPTQGHTFDDLLNVIYKNPKVVAWFNARKWGALEEMFDGKRGFYDTEGKFHYTGATGQHLHIGPDTHAVKNYNSKIAKGQQGLKFENPFIVYEAVETPKVELNLPLLNDNPIDISNWATKVSSEGTPVVQSNLPQMVDSEREEYDISRRPAQPYTGQFYNLSEAGYSNAGSYRGYHVPSGTTQVNITKDQLGKDKDTGELFTVNPSPLLGSSTILNSSASRNGNNPLSISHSNSDVGYKGSFRVKDGQNFASYNSVVDGLASAMKLYKRKYGNRSIRGINDGYQGDYSLTKNDKALTNLRLIWITNVSKNLGIDPTKRLNLDDKETMFSLMAAIAKQESNSTLSRNDLEAAWKKAFG